MISWSPKRVGPFVSEVLVMGAYTKSHEVVLLRPGGSPA